MWPQNDVIEPEEINQPLSVTQLNLEKSAAKRNLFGVQGGHIRCNNGRTFR